MDTQAFDALETAVDNFTVEIDEIEAKRNGKIEELKGYRAELEETYAAVNAKLIALETRYGIANPQPSLFPPPPAAEGVNQTPPPAAAAQTPAPPASAPAPAVAPAV